MKVLMISFTSLIQEMYHGKPREIAKFPGVKLTLLVPPYWKELWSDRKRELELRYADDYSIEVAPTLFTGNLHLSVFKKKIGKLPRDLQPDIIDIEDEPFNAGSAQIVYLRNRLAPRCRIVMHASQNDFKRYPFPFSMIERYSFRNVSAFLARNGEAKAILERKGFHGRIEIVPHGVDPDQFVWTRDTSRASLGWPETFTIGYIGAIASHKGLDTLVQAVRTLPCRLVFIGDGSFKSEIEKLARELAVDRRLSMLPAIPHREVPKYLAAMDVFVLPSRSVKNWREKFGRVLIEAMAARVPIVGSDSGEIPTVLGDAGLIFPENDVKMLEARLKFLIENPDERVRLAEKGYERVQAYYSWKVVARKTYSVYKSVLEEA